MTVDAERGLRQGQLSLAEVLFQSLSQVSPAGGIAAVAILGANFAGGALPLATLLSVGLLLLTAVSVSQLAKHLPSAGSVGTYISRALGGGAGMVTGLIYAISEMLIVSFVALLAASIVGSLFQSEFGFSYRATWVVTLLVIYALVAVVHELGVNVTARVQQVICTLEILLFLALSATLIVSAGDQNSLSVFGTGHANVEGYIGVAGLFPAAVFIITAFGGFETAASLAEEAKEPRRAIPIAVVGAVVGVGFLYVLSSYAASVYFGPDRMGGFAAFNNGDPWTGMTRQVWHMGWIVLFIIVVNSLYIACTAATTVSTRTIFALARARLCPAPLGYVSRRGSPSVALVVVWTVGLALALGLGLQYGPIVGLSIMVVTSTSLYVTIYILANLACMAYFHRFHRATRRLFLHVVVPVIGAIALFPVLMTQLGIPVFSFISKIPAPLTYGAYAAAIITVCCIIGTTCVAIKAPQNLARLGRAFDESEPASREAPS